MRIYFAASLAVATVGLAAPTITAFQPVAKLSRSAVVASSPTISSRPLFAVSTKQEEGLSPCSTPDGAIPESVTAQSLRSAILTNANGELVTLGEQMGKGTSIVVFLRHLG
jgi:hypothetical protein